MHTKDRRQERSEKKRRGEISKLCLQHPLAFCVGAFVFVLGKPPSSDILNPPILTAASLRQTVSLRQLLPQVCKELHDNGLRYHPS